MSRAYHKMKQRENAKATKPSSVHHGERDPLERHTFTESAHGKSTVKVGETYHPEKNLIKEYTNYVDNRIQVDNGNFATSFLTSQYMDFEMQTLTVDICQKATFAFTLQNLSAVPWTLPNLNFLIDRTQILWNGADSDDSWYGWHHKEMNQMFGRNVEATARQMHFYPPDAPEGYAFMPRNQQFYTETVPSTTTLGIDYSTVGSLSYPLGIPSKGPLVVPAGGSLALELDLTPLPLFSGHIFFPSIEGRKTRLRIYMNATDSIIGDSSSVHEVYVPLAPQTNKDVLITARAANLLRLQTAELRIHGHRITVDSVRHELHRRHAHSFAFKVLIPQRVFFTINASTGVEMGEDKRTQGLKGVFALWTLMLRDTDCEFTACKSEWIDGLRNITEIEGDGTVRDYEKKDGYIFSTMVDEVRFPGGNLYLSRHADYGQFMRADPANRGSIVPGTGVARAIGPDATATKPYYHSSGRNKRILALCYSSQPQKDYWWGTQYGGEYNDGDKVIKYTPGTSYFDYAFTNAQKNFWITGWRCATINWNGSEFLVIKQ
jgi:hypothetical protein